MARCSIRFLAEAADELEAADAWYAGRDVGTSENWRKAVRETLLSIRETPKLWAADPRGFRAVLIKPFHYQVVYFLRGDTVEIIAFAHTSRRPGYWRKRIRRSDSKQE